jgi:hypothetical protein
MSVYIPADCKLTPDPEVPLIELEIMTMWVKNDVLYCVSKKAKRSIKNLKECFDEVKKITGGEKVYMISDANEMQTYSNSEKEFFRQQLELTSKGLAIVSCKPMGKILSVTVLLSQNPPFPAKLFSTVKEAEEWIALLKKGSF